MGDRTGLGIARGFEKATSNILSLMQAREKIDAEKERTKVLNSYSKAQTNLAEYKLQEATKSAAQEEQALNMFKEEMIRRRNQMQNQGGGGQPGIPAGDIMAGYGNEPDMSYKIGGVTMSTPKRQDVKDTRPTRWDIEKEARTRVGSLVQGSYGITPKKYNEMLTDEIKNLSVKYGYAQGDPAGQEKQGRGAAAVSPNGKPKSSNGKIKFKAPDGKIYTTTEANRAKVEAQKGYEIV